MNSGEVKFNTIGIDCAWIHIGCLWIFLGLLFMSKGNCIFLAGAGGGLCTGIQGSESGSNLFDM